MGYTKLFSEIILSTVWREPDHVRILWITMLALKDRWHIVNASLPGLADAAKITIDQCKQGLEKLSDTDAYSRSEEFEGRRIEKCDGGWMILNGEKYRNKMSLDERREYKRIKQREYRKRDKSVESCEQSSPESTHTDTDTDTKAETEVIYKKIQKDESTLWLDKDAWLEFVQHRIEIKKPLTNMAVKKNMAVLEKFKTQQKEIIDMTIANGWRGLFAPDRNRGNDNARKPKQENFDDKNYVGTPASELDWLDSDEDAEGDSEKT